MTAQSILYVVIFAVSPLLALAVRAYLAPKSVTPKGISLERNRYANEDLLEQLSAQVPRRVNEGWEYSFEAEPGELTALLPDAAGTSAPESLDLLRDILGHLCEMDNQVQESCEKKYERSPLDIMNYRLHVGFIDLTHPLVTICYYGSCVNTSWDAKFQRDADGQWRLMNP